MGEVAEDLPEPVTRATFPSRREVSIADIVNVVVIGLVGKGEEVVEASGF